MSINRSQQIRRSLLTFIVATAFVLSTIYGSILLDELAGTSLTPSIYACQPSGGSCG